MLPEPTPENLAVERTEDLSRFESEGGSTEQRVESYAESRPRGLHVRGPDQRGRLLIVYATQEQHTYVIADTLAVRLRSHGLSVEIGDAATGTMPPPQDYDVVVLGVPMAFGHGSNLIATYIEQNRAGLADVPSALFTVSRAGTLRDHDPGGFLEQFLRTVAWQPAIAAAFAGGEPFPREGVVLRLLTWRGHSAAPEQGAAFRTDWIDVQRFADAIAIELANAARTAERTEPHNVGPVR
jgi:menaquinone-dependent protoporphyrinogen IX oxidase